jgi:nitrate/nitrite transport system ATP-binding protein
VIMDGQEVKGPSLDRGVVFQNYSLLPWLTTLKNVTFGIKARHPEWTKSQVEEHATNFLAMVGLEGDVIHRKPSQLSGGMRPNARDYSGRAAQDLGADGADGFYDNS